MYIPQSNSIAWRTVAASAKLLFCLALLGCLSSEPRVKPWIPFAAPWYEDFGIAMLSYHADFGRFPDSEEGLYALAPYIDPDELLESKLQYEYELHESGRRFRVYIPSSSPDITVGVSGELLGDGVLLLRGEMGPPHSYQPTSELLFLSTFEEKMLPALEHFFEDFGRYPCFLEWLDDVLLLESNAVLCRDPMCPERESHHPNDKDKMWSGPYLRGVDAAAIVRGPFRQRLRYFQCADGRGFHITVRGPPGLTKPCEGDLSLVRLRGSAVTRGKEE